MRDLETLFASLAKSAFRSKFHLSEKDRAYMREKGLATVISHARDFVGKRLATAQPKNDGKQTPFRGHPVFIAQHATACCCRGCLEKWHGIATGMPLTSEQENYIVKVLERWLNSEMQR